MMYVLGTDILPFHDVYPTGREIHIKMPVPGRCCIFMMHAPEIKTLPRGECCLSQGEG